MQEEEILEKLMDIIATQRFHSEILDRHTTLLEKQGDTLIKNTTVVDEHQRRSLALESEVKRINVDVETYKARKLAISRLWSIIAMIAAIGSSGVGILWAVYKFMTGGI